MAKKVSLSKDVTVVKKSKVKKLFKLFLFFAILHGIIKKVGKITLTFKHDDVNSNDVLQKCYAIFNGKSLKVDNEIFNGADIKGFCGGVLLDLSNSIIQEDISIHCKNIMSGTSIIVPQNVKVEISEESKWSGTSNQVPVIDNLEAPTIHIYVNNLMSGLEVKVG